MSHRLAGRIHYFPLHSPGCGVPDEICAPHPMGPGETVQTYAENPELIVVVLSVMAVSVVLAGYRRWRSQR